MRSKGLGIFRKLANIFRLAFSCFHKSYETEKNKPEQVQNIISNCHHCKGTGWVNKSRLENLMPSRYERLNNTPYSTCPLCKGTGNAKVQ